MPDNDHRNILDDSLSAKILFQIRRYEKISMDDLLSNIKTSDRLSIESRLAELHELITVVDTKTDSHNALSSGTAGTWSNVNYQYAGNNYYANNFNGGGSSTFGNLYPHNSGNTFWINTTR